MENVAIITPSHGIVVLMKCYYMAIIKVWSCIYLAILSVLSTPNLVPPSISSDTVNSVIYKLMHNFHLKYLE